MAPAQNRPHFSLRKLLATMGLASIASGWVGYSMHAKAVDLLIPISIPTVAGMVAIAALLMRETKQ